MQVSDCEENRLSAVEMFSQVVDISPYLLRDFIMKEAQTQEEVGALCVLKVSFYRILPRVFGSSPHLGSFALVVIAFNLQ